MKKIEFTTSCSKDRLSEIRGFVREQLAQLHISDVEKNQIVLAVDEACANAIIHGNNCDETKKLKLLLEIGTNNLLVEISDVGKFRPNEINWSTRNAVAESLRHKNRGGLGLALMNRIMDKVKFYSKNEVNICLLSKRIKKT
ncbi:MAG: ATP-binding protein [Sphingobacteriales bacterium]|nr:MAG: ATP-binding protein [Sphingobacteriales bacterium]